jgi:hypothetical protein
MHLFDLIPLVPPDLPGSPREDRSLGENVAGAIAMALLPVADFALVLFDGIWSNWTIALAVLPIGFALASGVLARLLGSTVGWTLMVAFGCGVACFIASGIAAMLRVFGSFFSGF